MFKLHCGTSASLQRTLVWMASGRIRRHGRFKLSGAFVWTLPSRLARSGLARPGRMRSLSSPSSTAACAAEFVSAWLRGHGSGRFAVANVEVLPLRASKLLLPLSLSLL